MEADCHGAGRGRSRAKRLRKGNIMRWCFPADAMAQAGAT